MRGLPRHVRSLLQAACNRVSFPDTHVRSCSKRRRRRPAGRPRLGLTATTDYGSPRSSVEDGGESGFS